MLIRQDVVENWELQRLLGVVVLENSIPHAPLQKQRATSYDKIRAVVQKKKHFVMQMKYLF